MVELGGSRPPRKVGGNRKCGPTAEDILDVPAKVAPSSDVDEDTQPVAMHCLDGVAKRYRPGPLADRQATNLSGGFGHPSGRRARVDGDPGRMEFQARIECVQWLQNGGEARRMVGTREGKILAEDSLGA